TGPQHGLDLPGAQRCGVAGLDHAQCGTIPAYGCTQGLADAQRVALTVGVDEDHMLGIVMDTIEFELSHRRPLRRGVVGTWSERGKSLAATISCKFIFAGTSDHVSRSTVRNLVVDRSPLCNNAAAFGVATRTGPVVRGRSRRHVPAPAQVGRS